MVVQAEIENKISSISSNGLTLSLSLQNMVLKTMRRKFKITFYDQGAARLFIDCYNKSLVEKKGFKDEELLEFGALLMKAQKDDDDNEDEAENKLAALSFSEGNGNRVFEADTDDDGSRKSSSADTSDSRDVLDDSIEPSQDPFLINGVRHPFGLRN